MIADHNAALSAARRILVSRSDYDHRELARGYVELRKQINSITAQIAAVNSTHCDERRKQRNRLKALLGRIKDALTTTEETQ